MRTTPTLGVIVGRFQVPTFHAGHRSLFEYVLPRHTATLVVLGSAHQDGWSTDHDPLPYSIREHMVHEEYPGVTVCELFDSRSDATWSANLDELIAAAYPGYTATLYGSRGSCLDSYTGSLKTSFVPECPAPCGTEIRSTVHTDVESPIDFRRGLIHAQQQRAPIPYPTVDIAVVWHIKSLVLLGGKKEDGDKRRFIGGFVDTADTSYEHAALRELGEEAPGLVIDDIRTVGSARQSDWRYRNSADEVFTTLFRCNYRSGEPHAADDIDRLAWVPISELENVLAPGHQHLGTMLKADLATDWMYRTPPETILTTV